MKKKAFKAALPHTLPILIFIEFCISGKSIIIIACVVLGNHGHPFSAIPYFSRRQRASCVYPSSGKGTSICGDRPSDRLLSEGSAHKRNLWAARSHCDFVYRIFA